MKPIKKILVYFAIILLAWFVYELWDDRNLLSRNEVRTYELEVGDHLTLKMYTNGSTGHGNCWVNENECSHVKFHDRDFRPNLQARMGYIGVGGWAYFTFKATKAGTDTIHIHYCPLKDVYQQEPSGCDAFKGLIKDPDYKIIVKVSDDD